MVNQAELKTQTRNEHLRNNKRQDLRERFLAQKGQLEGSNNQLQILEITPLHSSDLLLSSSAATEAHRSDSISNALESTSTSSNQLEIVPRISSDPGNTPPNTFRCLIEQHITQAGIDNAYDEPLFPSGPPTREFTQRLPLMFIQDIFDFENTYWQVLIKKTVTRTFDQELEYYNLLDLDADGEDVGIDVDDTTGQILVG